MLFYSVFKRLIGKEIVVELKNDLALKGTLHSVDQYLNFKLLDVQVIDEERFPHMVRSSSSRARKASVKNCFIRGSVVRYVQIPPGELDPEVLQDSTRTEVAKEHASR
ncbi:hypothetical protein GUITHDRAFT_141784 [Guillardia theta CCMP2712]|uniref:Sm domain-containing protein n=1 Tax=Guillardia theta (strain CCMP2712) TaxID=905079 RepID=L1IZW8_GUITC|nr:hypothetical protein GUITHDRAFT_141784 [Guillardia theta CCMP2712]EKX41803.1 hypothetical protein GUITHDRAFT_141784 [Guillardia theta CCMP2712]|eukprot:XP_005828783.1 hypothetical protein GUITHDRAFT_141784 [Guillardia theta CCMP2712]